MTTTPMTQAALSNQTITESMRLILMVRAYQVGREGVVSTQVNCGGQSRCGSALWALCWASLVRTPEEKRRARVSTLKFGRPQCAPLRRYVDPYPTTHTNTHARTDARTSTVGPRRVYATRLHPLLCLRGRYWSGVWVRLTLTLTPTTLPLPPQPRQQRVAGQVPPPLGPVRPPTPAAHGPSPSAGAGPLCGQAGPPGD